MELNTIVHLFIVPENFSVKFLETFQIGGWFLLFPLAGYKA